MASSESKVIAISVLALLILILLFTIANLLFRLHSQEPAPWYLSWSEYSRAPVLLTILLILLWLSIVGKMKWGQEITASDVYGEVISGNKHDTLFVLIHGHGGHGEATWQSIGPLLREQGDILPIDYPTGPLSNAAPMKVADMISQHIQEKVREKSPRDIVLVGHSMGALIARQTYLNAAKQQMPWVTQTARLVLLAGMNRGWDISGKKPSDMRWSTYSYYWAGSWFGRLAGVGKQILESESGAPFVANLRLEWMRWFRDGKTSPPEIVQLLGDIDDIVSDEDNQDLRVTANGKFMWLRVRGTGHKSILYATNDKRELDPKLAAYRGDKIVAAATQNLALLHEQNEELPYQTNPKVTHLVFVLHGIRDLGEWSAFFEKELRGLAQQSSESIAIASIRYGYFGMGQFVISDKQKYVRWFMDEYTETLAKYPNVKTIDLIGHSNGTYLIARALAEYVSLKVDKVVFAGSVVPQNFDWASVANRIKVFQNENAKVVRNYVAADDWVVALFPRLFELPLLNQFGNEIGSAGFNGFRGATSGPHEHLPPFVDNVEYIRGHHSAFLDRVPEIAKFIMNPLDPEARPTRLETRGSWVLLKIASDWFSPAVWLLLATPLIWIGFRVTAAATQPAALALLLYVWLVIVLLRTL